MRNLSLRRVSETKGVYNNGATEIFTEHLPSLLVRNFLRNLFVYPSEKTLYVNKAPEFEREAPSLVYLEFIKIS